MAINDIALHAVRGPKDRKMFVQLGRLNNFSVKYMTDMNAEFIVISFYSPTVLLAPIFRFWVLMWINYFEPRWKKVASGINSACSVYIENPVSEWDIVRLLLKKNPIKVAWKCVEMSSCYDKNLSV